MNKGVISGLLKVVILLILTIFVTISCEDSVVAPGVSDSDPPAAPDQLTAQSGTADTVTLHWRDNSDDETGFRISWGTTSTSFDSSQIAGENATVDTVTGLNPETDYYFRVCAVRVNVFSSYSKTVKVTTGALPSGPAAPTNVSVTTLSSSSVQINWTDNSDDEEGFDVYRNIDNLDPNLDLGGFELAGSVGSDITSFTDTGLPPAKNIFYFVVSWKGVNNSEFDDVVCAVTDSIASVPPPANVSASNGTEAYEIFLSWTWSEGAVSYKVYGSDSAEGIFYNIGETTNVNASISADNTNHYFYKVTAVDGSGNESDRSAADEGWAITPVVIFQDDFESEFSGWNGWPDVSTFLSYYNSGNMWWSGGANGSDSCFRLDGGYINSISEGVYAYKWLNGATGESYQPSSIQVYVKSSYTYEEGGEILGGGDGYSFWIYFSNNGNIYLYGTGGSVYIQSYSTNTWYRLQMKNINWSTRTYDFYVNGVLQESAMPFASSGTTGINHIRLWNDEPGADFYFDEFFIW